MKESCYGVDLNRNYDINFGGQGSSPNECSHLYQGPEALSEPETLAIANLLWAIRKQVKMFVSLHSFNQLWASPFAYTKSLSSHHGMHMDVLKTIQTAVHDSQGVMYSIDILDISTLDIPTLSSFRLSRLYPILSFRQCCCLEILSYNP